MDVKYKLFLQFVFVYSRVSFLFLIFYLGSNYLNTNRTNYYHLYLPFEQKIPFYEWAIYPYVSVFLFFAIPMFYLDFFEIKKLERSFIFSIIISCLFFLIFPTKLGFLYTPDHSINFIYSYLKQVDHPHNLVPSLHVCFTSTIFVFLYKKETRIPLIIFFVFWTTLIYSSVIFTHQHHFLDILGGMILSFISIKIFLQ